MKISRQQSSIAQSVLNRFNLKEELQKKVETKIEWKP